MSMKLTAVLSISPFFCEVGFFPQNTGTNESAISKPNKASKALAPSKPLFQYRLFLPHQSLTLELKKIWQEHPPAQVLIETHFCQKILDSKLGGSTAQLIPSRWNREQYEKQISSPSFGSLGAAEHISEATTPIQVSDLEPIVEKWKKSEIKRVCLQLAKSDYAVPPEKIISYLTEQGFEVFSETQSADDCPLHLARKNCLNACLSGVYNEHIQEIKNSLSEIAPDLSIEHKYEKQQSHSLWGWLALLQKNIDTDIVATLNIDEWFVLDSQEQVASWQSPWGEVSANIPAFHKLTRQPSQEIFLSIEQELAFSQKEFGYEPGPVLFARSQRPLMFDLLCTEFSKSLPFIQELGKKRFNDQMIAIEKNLSRSKNALSEMIDLLVFQLGCELFFIADGRNIVLTGYFADSFYPRLKKMFPNLSLSLDPIAEYRNLFSVLSDSQLQQIQHRLNNG